MVYTKDELRYKNPEKRRKYVRKYKRKYMREYRKKNPQKVKKWEKNRKRILNPEQKRKFYDWQNKKRRDMTNRIIEYKKLVGNCQRCGWNGHPEILQFHHREPKKKKFTISQTNLGCRSWDKIMEEIKRCDLICPNCHYYIHYQEKENWPNRKKE